MYRQSYSESYNFHLHTKWALFTHVLYIHTNVDRCMQHTVNSMQVKVQREKKRRTLFPRVISTTWHSIRHEFWYIFYLTFYLAFWVRERDRQTEGSWWPWHSPSWRKNQPRSLQRSKRSTGRASVLWAPFWKTCKRKRWGRWKIKSIRPRPFWAIKHPSHPTLFWGIVVPGHSFSLWNFVFNCWAHATLEHRIP